MGVRINRNYQFQPHLLTKGDNNDDGILDILDIVITINIILETHSPYYVAQEWTSDYNDDGVTDALDQVALVSCVVDNNCLYRDTGTNGNYFLYVGEPLSLARGSGENWDIAISSDIPIGAVQFELYYDDSIESLQDIVISTDISFMEFEYNDIDGRVLILIYSNEGYEIPSGSHALLELVFDGLTREVGANSPFDVRNVVVSDESGNAVTSMENSELTSPSEYSITALYPNPFNPVQNIKFSIPENSSISLTIYDLNGRVVDQLIQNDFYPTGSYTFKWEANNLSSGIYFVTLESESFRVSRKTILTK